MVGHTVLNVLSFVLVFGNVADAFNAIWYAYEGNYAEAIACAVGAIPLIGNLATGFKIGSRVVKGCNIVANGGKAAIGIYNGVQNVMNVDRMIRTGTGLWYDYLGQGVQFGLNMFVSAVGVSGAWSGISNLVDELNYKKMQSTSKKVNDIDGGAELTRRLEQRGFGSGKVWDYSKQFYSELVNFNDGYIIRNVVDVDMYLVQFHSDAQIGRGRSLKYWTTFDEVNGIATMDDYMDKMALLSEWGPRNNVSIAKIPAGTKITYAVGTARAQASAIESRLGGGLQLLIEKFNEGWILDTRPLP